MGKTISTVVVGAMFVLSAGTALAAATIPHGYGGDDDCRTGTRVITNGHVECKEKDEKGDKDKGDKDKGDKGGKDNKGSDDKKSNQVTVVVNQIIALINKLLGKKA